MWYMKEAQGLDTVYSVDCLGEGRLLLSLMPLESDEIVQVENSHTCYGTSLFVEQVKLLYISLILRTLCSLKNR